MRCRIANKNTQLAHNIEPLFAQQYPNNFFLAPRPFLH